MTTNLLRDDHAEAGALFKELDSALGAGDTRRAFALLDLAWARLAVHIRAEHLCLFPAILDALALLPKDQSEVVVTLDEAQAVVAQLRDDHNFFMNEFSSAIKTMRELLAAPDDQSEAQRLRGVRQKIATISSRLEKHNDLEEAQVYRWPDQILNKAQQTRLMAQLRREIRNLPPRFADPE
jgi:hypothetical protein